jgi:hypothetical protein
MAISRMTRSTPAESTRPWAELARRARSRSDWVRGCHAGGMRWSSVLAQLAQGGLANAGPTNPIRVREALADNSLLRSICIRLSPLSRKFGRNLKSARWTCLGQLDFASGRGRQGIDGAVWTQRLIQFYSVKTDGRPGWPQPFSPPAAERPAILFTTLLNFPTGDT